jgi:8-oxo-dGTP diphosphatase
VKVLVTKGTEVLLIEEARPDGSSFWTFPGGGLERGESPRAGLRREVEEELRCEAEIYDPLARLPYRHESTPGTVTFYTVYRGSLIDDPNPNPAEGILQYTWTRPPVPAATLNPFRRLINAGGLVEG